MCLCMCTLLEYSILWCIMYMLLPACEHEKPVPISKFSSHVEKLHADRDRLFEMEYMVSIFAIGLECGLWKENTHFLIKFFLRF